MTKSQTLGELAKALAAFQADLEPIHKNSSVQVKTKGGGSYSFDYATLDEILKTARPVLKKHGLAFSQFVDDGGLTTILLHESGEWIEARTSFDGISYSTAQELGSAITYLRRYALTAALGIAADEDDDGNVNAGNTYQRATRNGTSPKNGTNLVGEILDEAKKVWGDGPHYGKLNAIIESKAGKKLKVKDLSPTQQKQLLKFIKSQSAFDVQEVSDHPEEYDGLPFDEAQ